MTKMRATAEQNSLFQQRQAHTEDVHERKRNKRMILKNLFKLGESPTKALQRVESIDLSIAQENDTKNRMTAANLRLAVSIAKNITVMHLIFWT